MERWEYTIIDVSGLGKDVPELNRLGVEGWEAVGMVSTWGHESGDSCTLSCC